MRCLFTWSKEQYSTVQYSTVQNSTFSGRWDVSWHGASDGQTWRKLCCRCRTWMAWLLCVFSGEGARHVMSRFITFLNLKISKKRISGYWQYLNLIKILGSRSNSVDLLQRYFWRDDSEVPCLVPGQLVRPGEPPAAVWPAADVGFLPGVSPDVGLQVAGLDVVLGQTSHHLHSLLLQYT